MLFSRFAFCIFILPFIFLSYELKADGEGLSCPALIEKMGRQINIYEDEFAPNRAMPFGKPDPGSENFFFAGGPKGGPTFSAADALGPELADKPILIYRATGHAGLYFRGRRFDGVVFTKGPNSGRSIVSPFGLGDDGLAIVMTDLPAEVTAKIVAKFDEILAAEAKASLTLKLKGLFQNFSCVRAVCKLLDDSGLDVVNKMSWKEQRFPIEFINYIVNNPLKVKSTGELVTMKFFRLSDESSSELIKKVQISSDGFVNQAKTLSKQAGIGGGVLVAVVGGVVWYMSDGKVILKEEETAPVPEIDLESNNR